MTPSLRYSSAMPASPFALDETRMMVGLMLESDDRDEIRRMVHDGNLLKVKSVSNEKKLFNYIYNRLESFPDELKRVIIGSDEADSRYVNFISIMSYDNLFREFVFDVYHAKMLGRDPITDFDIMNFFEQKARESEVVADWKYETVFKLRRLYTRILFEAGLLKKSSGIREITAPMISISTSTLLMDNGFRDYLGATVGII
ncbi:DUF1819 family protein [Candidatus Methanoprimaticola sp. MG2]|uniref:DUF1819 family protein n=1 Tax=Candidatus Methanoprimaticola sp. MG2 TaxID=3228838 RepID=UPI0039C5BE2D